jgi:hypothetical protein
VNTTVDGDVARYAAAVRAAFEDLPGPEREVLLEDLEDHLEEVAAETGGPLEERLGQPQAYAAELRASAGLPAPGGARRRRRSLAVRLRTSRPARRLGRLVGAAAAHPAGEAVVGFLPELRPAWWVLRGWLAVMLASFGLAFLYAHDTTFPVPTILGSQVVGLLAAAAAVAGSVALGRRGAATPRARRLLVVANAALGLFALLLALDVGAGYAAARAPYPAEYLAGYPQPADGLRQDGVEISNIFAFDADGKPLGGVYLVDQDGNPVLASHEDNPDLEQRLPLDRDGNPVANRYPREQYQLDPATGQRGPVPAPEFRPPPGVRP